MDARLTIPFNAEARDSYVVYFSASAHRAPSEKDLEKAAERWRDAHLQDPLRTMVADYVKRGWVSIRVQPVRDLPELPVELLRRLGLGELEERVVQTAQHAVLVTSQDLNIPPRAGLWASLASALGIAELLDGVTFDPDALRVINRGEAVEWFSPMGSVSAARHIIVPFSIGDAGLGWMTTRGLQKFGLPDLQLQDIPPNLNKLGYLLNSTAQYLIEQVFRALLQRKGDINSLTLEPEIVIDEAVIQRAQGHRVDDLAEKPTAIKVSLALEATDSGLEMVTIGRPSDGGSDQAEWLYTVMDRLMPGAPDKLASVKHGDEMAAAHERAMAELPRVRARFQAGLRPGEVLYIKHGFPIGDGQHEYMWFTVTRWPAGRISGLLSNEPQSIPSMRMGQEVTIEESEVFDWTLVLAHGAREGGYTTDVVLRAGQDG